MKIKTEHAVGVAVAIGLGVLAYKAWRAGAKPPPPPPGLASLYVTVKDIITKAAIEGIAASFNGMENISDASGAFSILEIEPGNYTLQLTDPQQRYQPSQVELTFEADEVKVIEIHMMPVIPPPPSGKGTLVVTATTPSGEPLAVLIGLWSAQLPPPDYWMTAGPTPVTLNLDPGDYTVFWGAAEGWQTPTPLGATIIEGEISYLNGLYTPPAQVEPPPPEADKATLWGFVAVDSQNSDDAIGMVAYLDSYFAWTKGYVEPYPHVKYVFENILPGTYNLFVMDPTGRFQNYHQNGITLTAGETKRIDIFMPKI